MDNKALLDDWATPEQFKKIVRWGEAEEIVEILAQLESPEAALRLIEDSRRAAQVINTTAMVFKYGGLSITISAGLAAALVTLYDLVVKLWQK